MYENTRPASHRMAAELIEAGVDVNDIYRRLYERVPIEKWKLIARALEKIERFDDGRFAVTYISAADYGETGAGEVLTEGIIDFVRALEGVEVAAMIRDKTDGGRSARKVSLRSTEQSTSRRSPALTAAAGTGVRPASAATCRTPSWSSSSAPRSPLNALSERACGPRRRRRRDPAGRQADRDHLPRRRSPGRGASSAPRRATPALSTRSRPACLIVLLGRRATREQRRFMAAAQDLPRAGAVRRRLRHR